MKKLLQLITIFALAFIVPNQATSQVRRIPIYFHVMHGGFASPVSGWTLERYLTEMVCQVNLTYAGLDPTLLAAMAPGGGFPAAYVPLVADTKIQFFVKGIDFPLNHSGGAGTVKPGNMTEWGTAVNVFLYDYSSGTSLGRFVPVTPTAPWAEGGIAGQMDMVMIRSSAFTTNVVRGVLAHELGHFFGLSHLYTGSALPGGGLCNCPDGTHGDCVLDTPPVYAGSCNMSDASTMSQNVMQEGSSCKVFFTNGQKARMNLTFSSVTPAPCNRSLFVDASPVLGGHTPPAINISRIAGVVTVKATYSSCAAGGSVRFIASVHRWESNVACKEGVSAMTGWNPSTIITAIAPPMCTYRVTVKAVWADGSTYNYAPVVYTGPGYSYISSPLIKFIRQRFCQCTIPWVTDTKRDAEGADGAITDNMIQVKEDDVIDIPALLGMDESIEAAMGAALTGLEVFPNPAENTISFKNFDGTGFQYRITNVVGQVVDEGTMNSDKIAIDMLPGGQYLIQISEGDNRSNVMKFVKIK